MLKRLETEPKLPVHSEEFVSWLHREFYSRLPDELHWSKNRSGQKYRIDPGALRSFEVDVGKHQAPHHEALPDLLGRFSSFYGSPEILATEQLIALAAAHHRLAWIHPFGDGNGRVIRLYSQACLVRARVDALGLWTLSRGLARQRNDYYAALSAADQQRWNDLDGRGNLSDRALGEFCRFVLQIMLDQINFMAGLLQLDHLSRRIEQHLRFELVTLKPVEQERISRLLKAALREGEIERGRVGEIVGLRSTSAREIIRLSQAHGLLSSRSEKGPLFIVFSSKTLESYFPKLYQDLPLENGNT
jgi:Fic family protein